MKYFIAADAGGTKTEGVLLDSSGRVYKKVLLTGANPNDMGVEKSVSVLCDTVNALLMTEDGSKTAVEGAFLGIAGSVGYGDKLQKAIAKKTGIQNLKTGSDAVLLISAELANDDGGCLISGTGSVCFVRKQGVLTRIGGWGHLLDPCSSGSGFDLGRDAITAALHEHDGQGGRTMLTELVSAKLGAHPKDRIAQIYAGGKAFIAGFAGTVFDCAGKGDEISKRILEDNCRGLAKMLDSATKILPGSFRVALSGGIFTHYPQYVSLLRTFAPENISLFPACSPAIYGAALRAVSDFSSGADENFRAEFLRSYKSL